MKDLRDKSLEVQTDSHTCQELKFEHPKYLILPCVVRSSKALKVSSIGVEGSHQCI